MNPPRHAEHVCDVFCVSVCGVRGCERGVVQASKGPIPALTRQGGGGGGSNAGSL